MSHLRLVPPSTVEELPLCEDCGLVKKPAIVSDGDIVVGVPCENCLRKSLGFWKDRYQDLLAQGVHPEMALRMINQELDRCKGPA